jgi:hypothetical protein
MSALYIKCIALILTAAVALAAPTKDVEPIPIVYVVNTAAASAGECNQLCQQYAGADVTGSYWCVTQTNAQSSLRTAAFLRKIKLHMLHVSRVT